MKMKKSVIVITALALLAFMSIPAYASITSPAWLGKINLYSGTDDYYGQSVIAYETGSTAVLKITVTNTEGTTINLTKVWVTFDWGTSYVSTQVNATTGKITMRNGDTRIFFINFTVPDTSVASNMYTHYYTITANFTGGSPPYTMTGSNFAVYSADQADFQNLKSIVDGYPSTSFQSAQARILWNQAANETATANRYYAAGNFAAAKQSYSNALNDKNQAWSVEESYLTMLQDLDIQQIQAQIGSLNAMTSFFNGLSTMWVLFGIGWVLLGIGYIIKWLRKRPEPPPPATS
jgi:hypothetical protein